jgi:hypothetical protein
VHDGDNLKTYIDLCLYALICKALFEAGIGFGKEALNKWLETLWNGGATEWDKPLKALIDIFHEKFKAAQTKVWKKEGKELSVANFVKSRTYMSSLLEVAIPKAIRKALAVSLEEE